MTSQKKKVSESLSAEASSSSSSSFARAPSASNLPSTQHADVTSNDAAHAAASAKPWERSQSELNLKNKDKSAARASASGMDYSDCVG